VAVQNERTVHEGEGRMKAFLGACRSVVGLALVAVACGGCYQWPKDLVVKEDRSLSDAGTWAAVEVHLVGVNRTELPRWQGMSVSNYWSPSGEGRTPNEYTKVVRLGTGSTTVTINANDPIWKKWASAGKTDLVVLADLKGVRETGAADPRRHLVPIKRGRYASGIKQITIIVERNGVRLDTPVEPED
jgi:hypothetical protein